MKKRQCDGCGLLVPDVVASDWMRINIPCLTLEIDVCSAKCLTAIANELRPEIPEGREEWDLQGREKWDLARFREVRAS